MNTPGNRPVRAWLVHLKHPTAGVNPGEAILVPVRRAEGEYWKYSIDEQ
jgi:hypothetical protein